MNIYILSDKSSWENILWVVTVQVNKDHGEIKKVKNLLIVGPPVNL